MAKLSVSRIRVCVLGIQQVEEHLLFGVVRAGRIARRRADALIGLVDQILARQGFSSGA
jgi:hypothetical protein